jgi:Gpi18-like mannosyltransferase
VQMQNVYAVTRNVFPYAPVSMFYPALCLKLSGVLGIPFHIVIKLFAILSDVGIVLALYAIGVKLYPRRTAACCASLYAVSDGRVGAVLGLPARREGCRGAGASLHTNGGSREA